MTFCKLLYHRKCKQSGVGGQKKINLVNVVCECPLKALNIYYVAIMKIAQNIIKSCFCSFSEAIYLPISAIFGVSEQVQGNEKSYASL